MARIALLLPNLAGGGAERLTLTLAHAFAQAGHSPEFVVMQARGELLEEAKAAFPVHDLGRTRARQVPLALGRYLRRSRPHAVIAAMWPLTAIAPIAARIAGHRGPVLIGEHSTLSRQYAQRGLPHLSVLRASTFVSYRLASARIGVSHGVCADMAALSSMPLDKFVTIYNPVPPAVAPSPDSLFAANALWGTDGPRILAVGNLNPVKNHPVLLRAFAALLRPDARLMLLGRGESETALRALAVELGIGDRVIFAGFRRDPAPFYASANLFVLSSDYEGLPNVIIEALSFGLPVVSTDCRSGPDEILQGGQFGRLVPVGDAAALAAALDAALDAPVDRDALVRRASDFAPEIAARQYLEVMGL